MLETWPVLELASGSGFPKGLQIFLDSHFLKSGSSEMDLQLWVLYSGWTVSDFLALFLVSFRGLGYLALR